jgi:hypothetical protein
VDAGPLRDLLTAVAGFLTGALSGAFGVGGAVISTPAIRALGVPASLAVGTTLPSILPSAAAGALRYRREGLIDRQAVLLTVPVGLVAAVAGAVASERVPGDGHLLMLLTSALLAVTAVRMARHEPAQARTALAPARRSPDDGADPGPTALVPAETGDPAPAAPHHGRGRAPAFAAVGAAAGLLSGLLGVGGGIVMVPGFTQVAGLSIKSAIATSLVCVAALAVPGTVTHAVLGNIDWRAAAFLTLTVIPGSRLGVAATLRASDRALRTTVAGLLGVVAVLYAGGELVSLLR